MSENANTPLTNPKLKELFKKRSELDMNDQAAVNACMNELAEEIVTNAKFLSVINVDENDVETDENGNVRFKQGGRISFAFLTGPEDKPYFPAFTDWEEVGKWEDIKNGEVHTMVMSFDDYYYMTKENECGIVIDPFGANLIIDNNNIRRFKEIKDLNTSGHSEHVITEETKVMIGEPKEYPEKMVQAIIAHAKKNKNINALWLKLMANEKEESFLLAVDFDGDKETVFGGIAEAARPYLPQGYFIDMVPFDDKGIGAAASEGEPFYKKKKGLFGIFNK